MILPVSEELLAAHQGFQILRCGEALVFVDKKTRGPAIATAILFGLSGLFALAGLSFLLIGNTGFDRHLLVAALPLGILAVLTAVLGRFAYRSCRVRAEGPGERLIAEANVLKTSDGQTIAPLSAVRTNAHIDWTDGMGGLRFARVLSLRWPGGQRPIYKSYDRAEIAWLCSELSKMGIR